MSARDLILDHIRNRHPNLFAPPQWTKAGLRQVHAQEHALGTADHAHPSDGNAFERFAEQNLIEEGAA